MSLQVSEFEHQQQVTIRRVLHACYNRERGNSAKCEEGLADAAQSAQACKDAAADRFERAAADTLQEAIAGATTSQGMRDLLEVSLYSANENNHELFRQYKRELANTPV